ncbi:adenosyl-hopene transferase HpnH [Thiohalorhabdus methylotrophus]|uniref:Adenosyl-hopene transferase HpnH n=1 Tax=Thiohalorhabdus methylotrophus TaxID=3242694 RepID=A0ABV4TVG6_9GAMM
MGIPLLQQYRVGKYILGQKLRRNRRYPLVLMLEPLFQCNLACEGCGKIAHPDDILAQRMSAGECLDAVDECGAPVVSVAGGEPLLHKEMPEIVDGIIRRRKFVYLCTNALLATKRMKDYTPSPYLTFSIHLDGDRERHDASVCQEGVYDRATHAIRQLREQGFRVNINCTLFQGEDPQRARDFFDEATRLGVEGITVSPAFDYEGAKRHDIFMGIRTIKELFRDIFREGRGHKWPLSHSGLYLDFLAGNQSYECMPWGNPTRNLFGWQRPCYLHADGGYAATFRELMDETDWEQYGVGRHPKCENCMAHCGFEASAVEDTVRHPLKALKTALRGPRTEGPMVPDPPSAEPREAPGTVATVPVSAIGRVSRQES